MECEGEVDEVVGGIACDYCWHGGPVNEDLQRADVGHG